MYYSNNRASIRRDAIYVEDVFMRTLFLSLILVFIFGGALSVSAQRTEQVSLRLNRQAKVSRGGLTIKFVAVEDSRCPKDVNCVWAGNAKVTIRVTNRRGNSRTFDLNTNQQEKSAEFNGYEITLGAVTPYPRSNVRIDRNGYTAGFTVKKL
jgi:hypothetical protein